MLMRIRMRPDQAAATVATTTTALAMAMAMSMPQQQSEQCNALKFTFHGGSSELQLQSLTWVIARQKDKTVACTDRQRDRQAEERGNGEGKAARQADRQTGRLAGRQAGPSEGPCRAYLHAIKFPGLLLLSQGLCDHIESRFWHFGHNLNLLHFGAAQSCHTISSLSAVPRIAQSSFNFLHSFLSLSLFLALSLADIDWEIDSRIVFAELISISKMRALHWLIHSVQPPPSPLLNPLLLYKFSNKN